MASILYRLGRFAYRRWPVIIGLWLVLVLGLGGLASQISKPMSDQFTIPGIPSVQALDLQKELFPGSKGGLDEAKVDVVVAAPEGHTLKEPRYQQAVGALVKELQAVPQISEAGKKAIAPPDMAAAGMAKQMQEAGAKQRMPKQVVDANTAALSPLSKDGRVGVISWDFDVPSSHDVKKETQQDVRDAVQHARDAGLSAEVKGSGMKSFSMGGMSSEAIGMAVALLVLLLTFGSLVAAGMPLVTAAVGVALGTIAVQIATAFATIGTTTPILATMLGLAVGIDYSLFILSRFRSELHHTQDRAEAAGLAVGRAGSAVVFAGLTVIIALAALAVVRIPFLTYMGMAAATTVLIAVLVAITLLPAILGMLGRRAFALKVIPERMVDTGDDENNSGARWARLLGRAPVVWGLLVTLALGALIIPAKDLHLGLPSDTTAARATTERKAADLVTQGWGPGRNAPMLLVVDARKAADPRAAQGGIGKVVEWAAKEDGVANAQVVAMNKTNNGALVMITPRTAASDKATDDLLVRLQDGQAAIEKDSGTTVGVTGVTAIQADVSKRLTDALLPYLAIVIGLAFVLLMMVFRSVLVPLTATAGFLLSVLATLGATILIFQKGMFGLYDGAPLVSFLPIIMIGIVFGLAMDYQVFLVTGMREAYVHGDSAREAVVHGLRNAGRVVVAAALIMISVFAAFMLHDDQLIQSMGFALAVAIVFDAFLVRLVLVPATMFLLGDKAWWLPRWLDRILPKVDVEGESLARRGNEAAAR